jgi:hypothetical protein
MDRVNHNVGRRIKAIRIMRNKLDATKDRYLVERDIEASCNIFDLTLREFGMLTMNNEESKCTFEVDCTIIHLNVFQRNAIDRWPH